MTVRDDIEAIIHAWNRHETERGAAPVIDFDCAPSDREVPAAGSRLEVLERLTAIRSGLVGEPMGWLQQRVDSDITYLRAVLGERLPLDAYLRGTQRCPANGWSAAHVAASAERVKKQLADRGIDWGTATMADLEESEGRIAADEAPDAIRAAASDFEPAVRSLVGSNAPFDLTIEAVDEDAYWAYWLDGAGKNVRLRINLRQAKFTAVLARQFALHEVLGHGLQCASLASRYAAEPMPWVPILSIHTGYSVVSEGLAQALPLFVRPQDADLVLRVHLGHYLQMVRAEIHLAINAGKSVEQVVAHAKDRVPFWSDDEIADSISDRGANPLLRSYLWSYPAGLDWFMSLSTDGADVAQEVLRAAYRDPLTPGDLERLWPAGPPVGGA